MDYSSYQPYDSYSTSYAAAGADAGAIMIIVILMMLFIFATTVIMVIAMWKMFTKAGKPGWAAIVPFYNTIVMLEIAGRPMWWFAMFFIPVANLVFQIMLYIDLAKAFGKDVGYAIMLILFPYIGFPMLAFGNARYVGPVAENEAGYGPQPQYPQAAPYQQPTPSAQTPQQFPSQPMPVQPQDSTEQPQPPVQQ